MCRTLAPGRGVIRVPSTAAPVGGNATQPQFAHRQPRAQSGVGKVADGAGNVCAGLRVTGDALIATDTATPHYSHLPVVPQGDGRRGEVVATYIDRSTRVTGRWQGAVGKGRGDVPAKVHRHNGTHATPCVGGAWVVGVRTSTGQCIVPRLGLGAHPVLGPDGYKTCAAKRFITILLGNESAIISSPLSTASSTVAAPKSCPSC